MAHVIINWEVHQPGNSYAILTLLYTSLCLMWLLCVCRYVMAAASANYLRKHYTETHVLNVEQLHSVPESRVPRVVVNVFGACKRTLIWVKSDVISPKIQTRGMAQRAFSALVDKTSSSWTNFSFTQQKISKCILGSSSQLHSASSSGKDKSPWSSPWRWRYQWCLEPQACFKAHH